METRLYEKESVLSKKPKRANAFGCSFWLSVAHFGFLLVRKTKKSNTRQKSPNGNQALFISFELRNNQFPLRPTETMFCDLSLRQH